jgi:hypothetical protein
MDNLFDPAASKVMYRYRVVCTAGDVDDVTVCVLLCRPEDLGRADVDVNGDICKRQVKEALSCRGRFDVCEDCAVDWSRRLFSGGVKTLVGPVRVVVQLRRFKAEGGVDVHVLGGSCAGGSPKSLFDLRGRDYKLV